MGGGRGGGEGWEGKEGREGWGIIMVYLQRASKYKVSDNSSCYIMNIHEAKLAVADDITVQLRYS